VQDTKRLRLSDDGRERFQAPQTIEIDAIADPRAVLCTSHEASLLQNAQVLGNCRLRQGQLVHNLAAHARFFARQQAEDANSRGVPDGLRQLRQLVVASAPSRVCQLTSAAGAPGGQHISPLDRFRHSYRLLTITRIDRGLQETRPFGHLASSLVGSWQSRLPSKRSRLWLHGALHTIIQSGGTGRRFCRSATAAGAAQYPGRVGGMWR